MINSKLSLFRHWMQNHKRFALAFVALAFIGFLDATFLTIEHIMGTPVPCSIIEGCEKVLTSTYAEIGGIPTAFFGSLYYLVVFLLALISITREEKKHLLTASKLTIVGLGASLVFVFLQLFVIKAICLYCMISALTSTTLFVLGVIVLRKSKNGKINLANRNWQKKS